VQPISFRYEDIMSDSAQTRSDCPLDSIEVIEERLAMIVDMQRRLEKWFAQTSPAHKPVWLH
jgi:hypothetical protein